MRGLLPNVLVLATALSTGSDTALQGIAGQLRALSVQLTYRTVNRQALVVPGRSVLLWSVVHRGPPHRFLGLRSAPRRVRALVAVLGVAILITVVPIAGLVTVLRRLLELVGLGEMRAAQVAMLIVAPSVVVTGVRAVAA